MISRTEQIQAEQQRKAAALVPDDLRGAERVFEETQNTIPKFLNFGPVHIRGGGIADQSGFSLGAEMVLRSPDDNVRFRMGAAGSTRLSYRISTGVILPSLAERQVSIAVDAAHADYPKLEYYGQGPDSSEDGRTDYRLENTSLDFTLAWRPARKYFVAGIEGGPVFFNVGPGRDDDLANTETVYGPAEAPGIDMQTDFLRLGTFIDLDWRDLPGDPHKGSRIIARYQYYRDIDLKLHSFNRVSADAEHYIPFLNGKRVIALHAGTELSYDASDQVVPFYLQPTLGGPNDLRGFHRFRFHDNNLVRFNAEYRWEIHPGFDMALFGDAGKVFDRPGQISLYDLESSVGFGFRFKSRSSVVMRVDTGFSHEGFQVWLRFNLPL